MTETIKVPALVRELEVKDFVLRKAAGEEPYRLELSASSTTPIERFFGKEVLDHTTKAVQLDRAKRGAMPLLFNHDWNQVLGMVDSATIESERLMVKAHLFDTPLANEMRTMIEGGLRNVSIGYRLLKVEENDGTAFARSWEPYEVSVVSVPADASVGIGREQPEKFDVSIKRASPEVPQPKPAQAAGVPMTEQVTAAAGASADSPSVTAIQAEKNRREAIAYLCKANKIDARVEMRWIEDGATLEQVAKEVLDVMTERQTAKPSGAAMLGMSRSDTQRYSMVRAIRALKFPTSRNMQEAGFELECSNAVAKQLNRGDINSSLLIPTDVLQRPVDASALNARAMAVTPGSKGGYLVQVENMGFIDILRNRSVAMAMGARQLSGLVGNVVFPRQTGKSSVTWQGGDGTSVTATDQALGQLSMTPKTAVIVTDVSEQLLRQSSPSAEAFITADLAQTIAIDGVDSAVINGTGGSQPIGIKNTSGITSSQDAASATYAKILAFVSTAGALNAIRGNPGWVTTTAGAAKLMQVQRFSSTDTPLWTGNMLDGQLVGFKAMSSEQLSSSNLIFGSWDEVVIGDWGVLELSTDNGGTRFNQAQVGIRALWMVDVMLRYPQAFVVSVNLS